MKVRAFTELSNPPGSKDTEVMGDSEILEAIKINTKLSSASWKDDWKSCYFDFSQFHLSLSLSLSLSLQVALRIILFIPKLTCYYLLLLSCVASATNSTVLKTNPFSPKLSHIFESLLSRFPPSHVQSITKVWQSSLSGTQSGLQTSRAAGISLEMQTRGHCRRTWIRNTGTGAWQSVF